MTNSEIQQAVRKKLQYSNSRQNRKQKLPDFQVKTGYRMPMPDKTPENVRSLVAELWEAEPEQRPEFSTVVRLLSDMVAAVGHLISVETLLADDCGQINRLVEDSSFLVVFSNRGIL